MLCRCETPDWAYDGKACESCLLLAAEALLPCLVICGLTAVLSGAGSFCFGSDLTIAAHGDFRGGAALGREASVFCTLNVTTMTIALPCLRVSLDNADKESSPLEIASSPFC